MGPKKGKKPTFIIDGVETAELTRAGLEQFITKVKEVLERERQERNYYQIERDKITAFWEITRKQLDEARSELRNLERAKEESDEVNKDLLEDKKQKIKHLQYEQQSTAAALRAGNLVSLKAEKEKYGDQETLLNIDKRDLRTEMRELDLAAQDELRRTKLIHAEDISRARAEFEQNGKEIEGKAEKKLADTKAELGAKHRAEIEDTEYRKNKQIAEQTSGHNKAFTDLKNYYNDITINNLGLLTTLRQQMEEVQAQRERSTKISADAQAETRRVKEPLEKTLEQNKEFAEKLTNYAKDKAKLAATTKHLQSIETQFEVLKWEREVLKLRYERMEADREEMRVKFSKAVREELQKSTLKTCMAETQLAIMDGKDLTPTQLHSVLFMVMETSARCECSKSLTCALFETSEQYDKVATRRAGHFQNEQLQTRGRQVEDLRYEAARLRKAHNDLLATYEAKLAKLGVSLDELGFRPLKTTDFHENNRHFGSNGNFMQ